MGQWLSFVMGRTLSYEIHKVTLDDYEKVLSIRDAVDIHGGNDYIPNYFKTMMKSPENEAFSAIIDEQFVAFVLVSLINDKTTILLRSVRIRKSHSGHGIVKSLILWIIQHYKKRKVKVCWICFEDSSPYALEYIEKGIFQVITCRKCTVFRSEIDSVISKIPKTNVQTLNADHLTCFFEDELIRQTLFPSNCFISFWTSYGAIASNVPFILKENYILLGTKTDCMNEMIVSCGKWNASVFFTSYYVDIYGNQNNTSDLCDHLITHIDHCKKKFKGVVEMNVYTDCIDMTKIEVLLTEFNMPKNCNKFFIVIERHIREF